MNIFFIRHAEAEHLLENWNQKVNGTEFSKKIIKWQDSKLTKNGIKQTKEKNWDKISEVKEVVSSPILRAKLTAQLINKSNLPLSFENNLSEILLFPPKIFKELKLKLKTWMYFLGMLSFVNLSIYKILKDNYKTLQLIKSKDHDICCVSHEARIMSILFLAKLLPGWKITSKDLHPLGISAICSTTKSPYK